MFNYFKKQIKDHEKRILEYEKEKMVDASRVIDIQLGKVVVKIEDFFNSIIEDKVYFLSDIITKKTENLETKSDEVFKKQESRLDEIDQKLNKKLDKIEKEILEKIDQKTMEEIISKTILSYIENKNKNIKPIVFIDHKKFKAFKKGKKLTLLNTASVSINMDVKMGGDTDHSEMEKYGLEQGRYDVVEEAKEIGKKIGANVILFYPDEDITWDSWTERSMRGRIMKNVEYYSIDEINSQLKNEINDLFKDKSEKVELQ